jgi:hypothetical protein
MTDDAPRQLAVVNTFAGLHGALRQRAEELAVSREALCDLTGLQSGYAGRILSPHPKTKFGSLSLELLLQGLALRLIVVEDPEQYERIKSRIGGRNGNLANHSGTASFIFSRRYMRTIQSRGGKNSRKNMSVRAATALARKAADARWRKFADPKKRTALARKAALARWYPDNWRTRRQLARSRRGNGRSHAPP